VNERQPRGEFGLTGAIYFSSPAGTGAGAEVSCRNRLAGLVARPPVRWRRVTLHRVATRPVLRIFISSTAIDLTGYRDKVRDAVLRLEGLPVGMETFSALGGTPASECMRIAAEADAVICIVAHRYGYVPPVDLGGDGERSIAWLEVDAAKRAGKPVFAFLVDPKAPWTDAKEQDRLVSEPENLAAIGKAVRTLQEFKDYLGRECTRQMFTSSEQLAEHVTATLANFAPQATAAARVWKPLFCHALQPAQHFRGRAANLQELTEWLQSPVTPDRVISVVAAAGTGKTALVNQALREAKPTDRAGVFVWSFYEDPRTDAFLRAAYTYFMGEKDVPGSGMLERLQLALSDDIPHVIVMDGLERVQSEGDHGHRGELEDMQLKRFVRSLAGGMCNARALVTSRFPLVDLAPWTAAGHRAVALDDLELTVAVDVLRAWGVKGDNTALARSIEPLNDGGFYHALSVAVLGSYLGNFAGGDPSRAPEFSLRGAKEVDSKASKLNRILEQYERALTSAELDLLARLSLFPRGVGVERLGWIAQSGGEEAGALRGLDGPGLAELLERLKKFGLVFGYETDRQINYSAHPFLREFFGDLLGTKAASVHESVRSRLAPSLDARPAETPKDPAILDRYEVLIEQTLLAGRVQEAFDLYSHALRSYANLAWELGENVRGLRILERFVPQDKVSNVEGRLDPHDQVKLVNDLGMFASNLGDLERAGRAFLYALRLASQNESNYRDESLVADNLAYAELRAGRFPQALGCTGGAMWRREHQPSADTLAFRAASLFAMGEIDDAADCFQRATALMRHPLRGVRGVLEAESKLVRGDSPGALRRTEAICEDALAGKVKLNGTLCRCHSLLARLLLPDEQPKALKYLHQARSFACRSGDMELQLRCYQGFCELYRRLGDYPQSITEAQAGILLADTCGFGKYSIDLRLAVAETYLAADDPRRALQNARNALDRSEHLGCQYAWGKADGLHFCGMAHLLLGECELARQRLSAALKIRARLGHGRVEETRRALSFCQ
jgi:tetratricopeptide (TPR) repeat protein